jgi:hypothetical protein
LEDTRIDTTTLTSVANICAQTPYCKTVAYNQPEHWFKDLPQDRVTMLLVKDAPLSSTVELLILPKGSPKAPLSWPTFRERKQQAALGRHILLAKGEPLMTLPVTADSKGNPVEGENVVDALKEGMSVALVGHPGIGKTIELNRILPPLFQSLLDQESPLKDIFHRARLALYRYQVVDGKISCSVVPSAGVSLESLATYFERYKYSEDIFAGRVDRNDAILLLEMSAREHDPQFDHIPTIVALSAREVKDELKTFEQTSLTRYAARPPHTEAELAVLVTALFYGGDESGVCKNMGLRAGSSLQDVLHELHRRVQKIGPLARNVLNLPSVFS